MRERGWCRALPARDAVVVSVIGNGDTWGWINAIQRNDTERQAQLFEGRMSKTWRRSFIAYLHTSPFIRPLQRPPRSGTLVLRTLCVLFLSGFTSRPYEPNQTFNLAAWPVNQIRSSTAAWPMNKEKRVTYGCALAERDVWPRLETSGPDLQNK